MVAQKNIRVVLVNTSHPGNIGAVARAMKNMCLSELVLVQPKQFPHEEASARAAGAGEVLANAKVVDDLPAAIEGCSAVIGTSARERSIQWSMFNPKQCAEYAVEHAGKSEVALVFGRENSGLTNEELDFCTHLVHIPTNSDYSSLNLAMAVQVISYEVMLATMDQDSLISEAREVASSSEMEGFYAHLQQALTDSGFIRDDGAAKLMRRLRRLFYRAQPDGDELNLLRGMLSALQGRKSMRKD